MSDGFGKGPTGSSGRTEASRHQAESGQERALRMRKRTIGHPVAALIAATVIAFIGFVFAALGWFSGTGNVRFQSSNGEWTHREFRQKGEDFLWIATLFEAYRVKCWPSAVLQRTTVRPTWHDWDHWFNDYSEPKWKVPYAAPIRAEVIYPNHTAQGAKSCASQILQIQEVDDARERAIRLYGRGPEQVKG